MKAADKQGLLSHTGAAISPLLSHPEIFIDSPDEKAETEVSNKRDSEKHSVQEEKK